MNLLINRERIIRQISSAYLFWSFGRFFFLKTNAFCYFLAFFLWLNGISKHTLKWKLRRKKLEGNLEKLVKKTKSDITSYVQEFFLKQWVICFTWHIVVTCRICEYIPKNFFNQISIFSHYPYIFFFV